jgi:MFS family permease
MACVIHFTGAMSFGMFLLFPLFVRSLGGDELTIGLLLGTGFGASVLLRPVVGALLDRHGRRRVLLWSGLLSTASAPLFIFVDRIGPALFLLTIVRYVAGGALFAAYFTYATDLVPSPRRVEGLAIFGVAGMAPNGLGPALGEVLIARAGYPLFFLASTAAALLSTLITLRVSEPGQAPAPTESHPPGRVVRNMVRLVLHGGLLRLMAATVLFGAGVEVAFFFVAPFARDLGIERAAPFFASYATTTIVLRIFGRRLPDRLGHHPIALPAFAIFALGLATLCFLPLPGTLVLAGIACGAGHGSLFPVLNALAVSRTPPRFHGTIISLYTAALDAGAVLGTPLSGAVARVAGYRVMFAVMSAFSVGGLLLLVQDRRRHHAPGSPTI